MSDKNFIVKNGLSVGVDTANVVVNPTDIKVFTDTNNYTAVYPNTVSVIDKTIDKYTTLAANSLSISNSVDFSILSQFDDLSFRIANGSVVGNTSGVFVGSNVVVSTADLKIGNSTVNSVANSSSLTIGTSVVNSTSIAVGSNVVISTADLKIGNSTVNAFINSSSVSLNGVLLSSTSEQVAMHNGGPTTRGMATIIFPEGASHAATTSSTGAIKIAFPTDAFAYNTMIRMRVELWDYAVDESVTLMIAGYITSAGAWSMQTVTILAAKTDRDFAVRFGNDGASGCVWIGELTDTWGHLRVYVAEAMATYNSDATPLSRWQSGWAITVASAFDTVDDTISGNLPVATGTAATGTSAGIVELATNAETRTGTDTTRAITPDGLTYAFENQSKAASGYQFLPSGLCIQWGKVTTSATTYALTFPIAFPTVCCAVISTNYLSGHSGGLNNCDGISVLPSTTGVTFSHYSSTTALFWIAIGY